MSVDKLLLSIFFIMYFSKIFRLTVYEGTVRSCFCVVQSYSYMYICVYIEIFFNGKLLWHYTLKTNAKSLSVKRDISILVSCLISLNNLNTLRNLNKNAFVHGVISIMNAEQTSKNILTYKMRLLFRKSRISKWFLWLGMRRESRVS